VVADDPIKGVFDAEVVNENLRLFRPSRPLRYITSALVETAFDLPIHPLFARRVLESGEHFLTDPFTNSFRNRFSAPRAVRVVQPDDRAFILKML